MGSAEFIFLNLILLLTLCLLYVFDFDINLLPFGACPLKNIMPKMQVYNR